MEVNTFIIDIDDTISITERDENDVGLYEQAKPIQPVIDKINLLYDEGHKIVLFTARGVKTYNGVVEDIEKKHKSPLQHWLRVNNVRYDELIFGKPWGPNVYYIDDKGLSIDNFVDFHPSNYPKCLTANKWKTYAKL